MRPAVLLTLLGVLALSAGWLWPVIRSSSRSTVLGQTQGAGDHLSAGTDADLDDWPSEPEEAAVLDQAAAPAESEVASAAPAPSDAEVSEGPTENETTQDRVGQTDQAVDSLESEFDEALQNEPSAHAVGSMPPASAAPDESKVIRSSEETLVEPESSGDSVGSVTAQPELSGAILASPIPSQDTVELERGNQMRIDRGAGNDPLWVPRDERLEFNVHLNLGFLGEPDVGSVKLSSRVSAFRPSSLVQRDPAQSAAMGEQAMLEAVAGGSYAVYELKEIIKAAYLPQEFPAVLLTTTQSGSENRRRELKLGLRDGTYTAQYRSDHHCKACEAREHFIEPAWVWQDERHCPGCKRGEHRVWRDPRTRVVPEGALDMLGAVYFARSQIQAGHTEFQFSLIDKLELWDVRVRQGKQKLLTVDGGRFDAVELLLDTRVPPGETGRSPKDFSGLFGIKGTLSIWFHRGTGVPVLIRGEMPAGIMDLDVRVELNRWRGTPADFRPLSR